MTEERFYLVLVVACGVLFLVALVWSCISAVSEPRRKKAARFKGREALAADEFYNQFYAETGLSKAVVLELLQEVAKSVEVDPNLLRPSDRFKSELADIDFGTMFNLDGGLFELTSRAEMRLRKLGAKVDLSRLLTLEDYIRTLGELESRKSQREGRAAGPPPAT